MARAFDFNGQISQDFFKEFGVTTDAYIQKVPLAKAKQIYPELQEITLHDTVDLEESYYSVHAADGAPILLATDIQSAQYIMESNNIKVQQRH